MSQAAEMRGALRLGHEASHRRLGQASATCEDVAHGGKPLAVADEEKAHALAQIRPSLQQIRESFGQNLDPVPRPEGADEADHAAVAEAVLRPDPVAPVAGVEPLRVHPVRVHENPLVRDAPLQQLLPQRLAHHGDEIGGAQAGQLDPRGQILVAQRAAPVAGDPDLGAVVFEDERQARAPGQDRAGPILDAVALI